MTFPKIHLQNEIMRSILTWVFFLLFILYAWHQSHFQYQEYWSEPYKSLVIYVSIFSVLFIAGMGIFQKLSYEYIYILLMYLLLIIFYGVLENVLYNENFVKSLKSAIFLVAMLEIIKTKENLNKFLVIHFVLGMILVILNMVTILHWLNVIELPYEKIARIGGSTNRPDLDPLSFGVFGRTESYVASGHILPRLQGYSSEPLHWAYFVLLTFSCGTILFVQANSRKIKLLFYSCFIALIANVYFIKSTTLIISVIYILICWCVIYFFCEFTSLSKYKKILAFTLLILVPGFIIPFTLGLISNVEQVFNAETIFNEKNNWAGKIDYLYMGVSLYIQSLPSIDTYTSVSHNYVLDMYLKHGYLLIIPLILFLFEFINLTIKYNKYTSLAVVIFIVTITLTSPFALFSPGGVVWGSLILGSAYHLNTVKEKIYGQ